MRRFIAFILLQMNQVRCRMCLTKLPTPKKLLLHYLNGHSKLKLAVEFFKLSVRYLVPKIFYGKFRNKTSNKSKIPNPKKESNIMYRTNAENETDKAVSVINSNKTDNFENTDKVNNKKLYKYSDLLRKLSQLKNETIMNLPSSASSEDSIKRFSFKKRIRRRRDALKKGACLTTQRQVEESLNENTGTFYLCHCRNDNKDTDDKINIIQFAASDTESASDSLNDLKLFCSLCGNGYKNESLLLEHMKIHGTQCRVCNEIFSSEHLFKQHIQNHLFKVFVCPICSCEFLSEFLLQRHTDLHQENFILDTILDMEEDYNLMPCSIPNLSYESIINYILSHLGAQDLCYYESTVPCTVCCANVLFKDYSSHMQNVHCTKV